MLYRTMRHPWCNFALMKKCRDKISLRKMIAQRHSNFAVSPNGFATAYRLRRHTLSADSRGLRRCIEILKTIEYEDNRRT